MEKVCSLMELRIEDVNVLKDGAVEKMLMGGRGAGDGGGVI